MPEFDRESGSGRIFDFILFLREAGWKVTFVSRHSIGNPDRYVHLLEEAGVIALPAHGDDMDALIQRERFDVAVLAFWHIGELWAPRLRALSPRTTVVVDSVDLHFVRNARYGFMQGSKGATTSLLDESLGSDMVRELNAYASADAVLTVSDTEANLLNVLLGDRTNAAVVPDCEDLPRSTRPFGARRGLLFVGNFRHAPNVDAVNYLCRDVLPRLPAALLERHPLYIVGNGVNDTVRAAVASLRSARLVGWVPTLLPYLSLVRAALVPLRYGAGTKRKLVQSLMVGTPAVSTSIGAEGLDLQDGEQVLVADDPDRFAEAVGRLVEDEALWERLASKGRPHVLARHGRDVARRRFSAALEAALTVHRNRQTAADLQDGTRHDQPTTNYRTLVQRIRVAVDSSLPPGARVLVASKGDDALLDLEGRHASHFPQAVDGGYAGYHPRDGVSAIAELETLRKRGAQYLLLPSTGLWWLDHYTELHQHLAQHCRLVWDRRDTCLIFELGQSGTRHDGNAPMNPALATAPAH